MCARPHRSRLTRSNVSTQSQPLFKLFSSDESRGLREIRRVSRKEIKANLASGIWRERYDGEGQFLGVQIRSSQEIAEELDSSQTSTTINAREIVRYVTGVSRTAHLTEEQRLNRDKLPNGRRLPPEDSAERLAAKVKAFEAPASRVSNELGSPLGDRAVRIYPNTSQ
jgi:hypothetical protein